MTYGRVRVAVETRCPDCDHLETLHETAWTEEHRHGVVDDDELEAIARKTCEGDDCEHTGDRHIRVRILDVDERLTGEVGTQLRRRYEVIAEKTEGEDPYTHHEALAAVEAIDRVREIFNPRLDLVDDDPVLDVDDLGAYGGDDR